MSQLKNLCEIIDSLIPEKINADELYKYLQAFTNADHGTLLSHEELSKKLSEFEWIQQLDYMKLLRLFETIEPFVKIKTQEDMLSIKHMYEEISIILSKELIDDNGFEIIRSIIYQDLYFVSSLMSCSVKSKGILQELGDILIHKPVNYSYDRHHTPRRIPRPKNEFRGRQSILIDELRFKILGIIYTNIVSMKESQKIQSLDIQSYLLHWHMIVDNIDYCLPDGFNNDNVIKNIIDIIVEILKENKFIPGVLAYQIVSQKTDNSIMKVIENEVSIKGESMLKAVDELREFIKYINVTRKLVDKITGFENCSVGDSEI